MARKSVSILVLWFLLMTFSQIGEDQKFKKMIIKNALFHRKSLTSLEDILSGTNYSEEKTHLRRKNSLTILQIIINGNSQPRILSIYYKNASCFDGGTRRICLRCML